MTDFEIRPETEADLKAIHRLHTQCFPTGAEANLVDQLRKDKDLAISLCAIAGDQIIGHVAFSKMIAPFKALGLAPVSVAQELRKQGVAHDLIRTGLIHAKEQGYDAAFVLGDPAYYTRFGFLVERAAQYDCDYAGPYFMILPLAATHALPPTGRVSYAHAFSELS